MKYFFVENSWCAGALRTVFRRVGRVCLLAGLLHLGASAPAQQLITDTPFQRGVNVKGLIPATTVYGTLQFTTNNGIPYWGLAQWYSQQSILGATPTVLPSGAYRWSNPYKSVTLGPAGTTNSDVILYVDSIAEYGGVWRTSGQNWPHLLVEQNIGSARSPWLSDLAQLRINIEARLNSAYNQRGAGYDANLHAAEFVIYFTVQNLKTPGQPGYGDYLWFGLKLYDDRYAKPGLYANWDGGTSKYIYNIGLPFTDTGMTVGAWKTISGDLLPYIKTAFNAARAAGALPDSGNLADYRIGAMNMGWEVPGLSQVEMLVRSFGVQALGSNSWVAGTGSFKVGTNWAGGAVPTTSAYVDNGGTVQISAGDPAWPLTGDFVLGQTAESTGGNVTQSGGTVSVGGTFVLADAAGTSGTVTMTGGNMTVTGETDVGNRGTAVMTINGGAFNNGGVLQVANGPGSTATLNILAGTIQSTGNHNIGRQGVGICNLSGGTATYANMYVGDRTTTGSEGSYGTMNHSNGTLNVTALLAIGNGLRTANHDVSGVYNLSGSGVINMTNGAPFVVGRSAGKGVMNMSGGTLNHNVDVTTGDRRFLIGSVTTSGYAAEGVINQSGGTVNNTVTNTVLGYLGAGSKGEYTLSGTGVANLRDVVLGNVATAIGTFNLNGGILIAQNIMKHTSATGTFNFNGGTLQARVSTNAFMQGLSAANVLAGGAVVDTAGNDITIAQELLNGGGGGGLTKRGAGTLTLAGTNTYTGDTIVQGGTLQLNVACLNTNAVVRLTNGAVLNLNFGGTNVVGAFVVNGVNQGTGLFDATTHVGLITGAGKLQVGVVAPPVTLTNLTVVGGTHYQFTVPGSGSYIVQATTNLADPSAWVSLVTNTAPFTFTDTNALKQYSRRFYRTVPAFAEGAVIAPVMPARGVCAHRGALATHPENTLTAFREAVRLGAHMIEFDINLTKDGRMVLMHDATVDRTTDGSGYVTNFTLAEIRSLDAGSWKNPQFAGEQVPTFEETLAMMPLNIWLNVHVKGNVQCAVLAAQEIVRQGRLHQAFLATGRTGATAARAACPGILICNMQNQGYSSAYVTDTVVNGDAFLQLLNQLAAPEDMARLKDAGVRINSYLPPATAGDLFALFDAGVEFPLVNNLGPMLTAAQGVGIAPLVPQY